MLGHKKKNFGKLHGLAELKGERNVYEIACRIKAARRMPSESFILCQVQLHAATLADATQGVLSAECRVFVTVCSRL